MWALSSPENVAAGAVKGLISPCVWNVITVTTPFNRRVQSSDRWHFVIKPCTGVWLYSSPRDLPVGWMNIDLARITRWRSDQRSEHWLDVGQQTGRRNERWFDLKKKKKKKGGVSIGLM